MAFLFKKFFFQWNHRFYKDEANYESNGQIYDIKIIEKMEIDEAHKQWTN